ncbi:carbohydrate ABC transporter permease [Tetragenococcus koreensis]|uniref:Sugar ABC transporter permease protein n=1 Tax=Tetragenococcus koreensis TaxID=290335 RepID=A0AAN4RJM3_9ENTE|nr:carbohydrate ABC transporter permease [Tetragenococcus koreensis]AYW44811.1 carbohydrate ABC transporter permease [Tetragenococcus koreensis]MCF1585297.1 carbohydrate ABC transporter permease [Tetragenococcus koreensis]MCF1614896.1 carbohydrate ABC transporter permease [Tetragenococcus koreensis]MCF1616381.1 carbohydrate ABC transporter permease [Tetragenococcus koreensis]MCF1618903.1 carbohydrate ABC transporter permease [Tetragenococcus koreensis]
MNSNKTTRVLFHILSILLVILFIFPLIWMIVSSLKPEAEVYDNMGSLQAFLPSNHISEWFGAYESVFSRFSIFRYILNSVFYAFSVTIGSIIVNSLAGYAFAVLNFRFKKLLFGLMIGLLAIPGETILITKFVVTQKLGILDTPLAVILPLMATPLYIYMFTIFFRAISTELQESAVLDGANKFQIYWKIMLPMSKPAVATVGTLSFIMSWNDYIWPLMVLTNADRYPLQVAITNINNTEPVYINQVMAILTLSTIPLILIYVFFQKYLVQGLGASGTGEK